MKTRKIFTILITLFATSLLSCTHDEADSGKKQSKDTEQGTTFVGGATLEPGTRTSLTMTFPGGSAVNYFWEKGDKIWTVDGSSNGSNITGKAATALFQMAKKYYTPTVQLYYPGQNATAYNQVNIATEQTQIGPNNTSHLGQSGDCGTAIAYQQGDGRYAFNLDHKAAYLCLMPRSSYKLNSTYITKIKITADNNIAGTYTLTPAGLTGSGSSNVITLHTKGVGKVPGPYEPNSQDYSGGGKPTSIDSPGFPITNTGTSQITNAAYIVIAPGQHALSIEYTYYDCMSLIGSTVVKTIPSTYYAANTVYPITADINNYTIYEDNNYYMWDAQLEYWAGGAKPSQPYVNFQKGSSYPIGSSDPRNYNRYYYSKNGTPNSGTQTTVNCIFNANTALWYMMNGGPTLDKDVIWAMKGQLHAGGLWVKKRTNIPNFAENRNPRNTRDFRINTQGLHFQNLPVAVGRPANLNEYFFLPAFGLFNTGVLRNIGFDRLPPNGEPYYQGYYWTNTPASGTSTNAIYFSYAYHTKVGLTHGATVSSNNRYMGFILMTSEDQFRPNGM